MKIIEGRTLQHVKVHINLMHAMRYKGNEDLDFLRELFKEVKPEDFCSTSNHTGSFGLTMFDDIVRLPRRIATNPEKSGISLTRNQANYITKFCLTSILECMRSKAPGMS